MTTRVPTASSRAMKIVLAYSGGLDTSVLLSWIKETHGAEMIAFCANIGQEEELKGLDRKAKKTGAAKVYIDDLQEEFARDFILGCLANDAGIEDDNVGIVLCFGGTIANLLQHRRNF